MGVKKQKILIPVSGWKAVELLFKCVFVGLWEFIHFAVRRLWKGHRRKISKNLSPVELTVDSSIGIHCYIKIMGVKYHYVETGPKTGTVVLILGDAPDASKLWVPSWASMVRRLAENDYHVVTLDLRGTGGSECGDRRDLSPPKAVEELTALLQALGVSNKNTAILIGFGVGGMLTWYLAHCRAALVRKFAVIGAPHPGLYWQYPPAAFCQQALYFVQWAHFPERWLAEEGALRGGAGSRARDWRGALNYIRGAAWWRIAEGHKTEAPALLLGARASAAQLVSSAQHCANPALRLLSDPGPADPELPALLLDFIMGSTAEEQKVAAGGRGLVGRVLCAVAGRGRDLTARLALPLPALSAQA